MIARRSAKHRGWPARLYEPRPGYLVWRHPDGRTFALGSIPLAHAVHQAQMANAHLLAEKPSIVDRLTGGTHTVGDLLDRMPVSATPSTAKARRSLDRIIRAGLGNVPCNGLTVAACATMLDKISDAGKARSAEAVRSRLIAVCRRGQALGWLDFDPASVTSRPRVKVLRGRLTLETFRAIHARASEAAEWLPHAMLLALITGADRSTVAGLQRADVAGGYLTITRTKTSARIAIPLVLRLDCIGVTLAELVAHRTGVVSKYLLHHVNPWGNAPAGSRVHPDRISHAFTLARRLAGIPDAGAVTFHEIRSLAARLYTEQGNVDVQQLLGHAQAKMTEVYKNPRGVEAIKVRVA